MIIVRLIGGLGNQMFQYAIGKHLSIINNVDFKFDISDLQKNKPDQNYTKRDYELSCFRIIENFADDNEIKRITLINETPLKFIYRLFPYYKRPVINEKGYFFDNNIFKIKNGKYLNGYWQSEMYFKEIREILISDFTLKNKLSDKAQNYINTIKETNSVSLHIRRGDYIKSYSNYYHILNDNYYENAINHIEKRIKNIKIFIFTDDFEWASNKYGNNEKYIIVQTEANYEDLYLMSLCKHNIIANSSFSWWGAWLNQNENKICIAPKKWFKKVINTDIIPERWIKI